MALLLIADLKGTLHVHVLPNVYRKAGKLFEGQVVLIKGVVKNSFSGSYRRSAHRSSMDVPLIQARAVLDIAAVADLLTSTGAAEVAEIDFSNFAKRKALPSDWGVSDLPTDTV